MTTPAATYPPPPGSRPWGRAARDAWSVQWRCQAVMGVLGLVATIVLAVSTASVDGSGLVGFVWLAHAVLTLVVGYPVGTVAGRLLPEQPTRATASWSFALAGAAAGAVIMVATNPAVLAGYALFGAVVAGSARAWAHRAIVERTTGTAAAPATLPV